MKVNGFPVLVCPEKFMIRFFIFAVCAIIIHIRFGDL